LGVWWFSAEITLQGDINIGFLKNRFDRAGSPTQHAFVNLYPIEQNNAFGITFCIGIRSSYHREVGLSFLKYPYSRPLRINRTLIML